MGNAIMPHIHLSHFHIRRFCFVTFGVCIGVEALAATHIYVTQRDIVTSGLIVVGWFRESLMAIIEVLKRDL